MWGQVQTCLEKNFLEKCRNPIGTFVEYFSHFVVLYLLSYGYYHSGYLRVHEKTYASIKFSIPPVPDTHNLENYEDLFHDTLLPAPLPVPPLDMYVMTGQLIQKNVGKGNQNSVSVFMQTEYGQRFGNLLKLGAYHFVPDNEDVKNLVQYLNDSTLTFHTMHHHIHESQSKALEYILSHTDEYTFALIILHEITPERIDYVIRQNYSVLPNTNLIVNWAAIGLHEDYQLYYLSGFLSIQRAIDDWAFQYVDSMTRHVVDTNTIAAPLCSRPPVVFGIPYPTPQFQRKIFYTDLGFLLGLAMTMATMYPLSKLVKSVVEEKESTMREVMKIMGLCDWAYQLSWFVTALTLFTWIGGTTALWTHLSFLSHSDPILLFFFFFTFSLSEITYGFLITSFLSRAKVAAIVAPVVLFVTLLPRFMFYGSNENESVFPKYAASLLSPTAFSFGADIIAQYEQAGVGVQFYNASNGDYSFMNCIYMLLFDFALYGVLASYLDQVIPTTSCTNKHPLFFMHKPFWVDWSKRVCRNLWNRQGLAASVDDNCDVLEFSDIAEDPNSIVEPLEKSDQDSAKVIIVNLCKQYGNGKVAVRELNLALLEGHVTCLLGHNGCGKSTTLGMLTGLVKATSGGDESTIYGCRINKDLQKIRRMTGICPQNNVIFPALTVTEHLRFFAKLKGFAPPKVHSSVLAIAQEVGLADKINVPAVTLSGGMKRKLCLAMALIGDPKVILLDEPTSGMDPISRRATWDMLQRVKAGRVVLLTTHFMDEADFLGDRIAIMSQGRLRCSGSSLFIKNRYGAGYLLTIAKESPATPTNAILTAVRAITPLAEVDSSAGAELVLQLPVSTASSFPDLFAFLQSHSQSLCISSYGISITSLERVFVRLARECQQPDLDTSLCDYSCENNWAGQLWLNGVKPVILPWISWVKRAIQSSYWFYAFDDDDDEDDLSLNTTRVDEGTKQSFAPFYDTCDIECQIEMHSRVSTRSILLGADFMTAVDDNDDDECECESEGHRTITPAVSELQRFHVWTSCWQKFSLGCIQVQELFKKRIITNKRDLNGLFFQLMIPAIAIVAILSILAITLIPNGRSITLNAAMFPDEIGDPVTDTCGHTVNNSNPVHAQMSTKRMELFPHYDVLNSSALSRYLLDTDNPVMRPNGERGFRFGSYVYGDSIPTTIIIDWVWVHTNMDMLLRHSHYLQLIIDSYGLNNKQLSVAVDLTALWGVMNITTGIKLTEQTVRRAVDLYVSNITSLELFKNTIDSSTLYNFIGNIFPSNVTSLTVPTVLLPPQGLVMVDMGAFRFVDNEVILSTMTLTYLNQTISLDNITLSPSQLMQFMPDHEIVYSLDIPSPYSVLHNTSALHGMAAFMGELSAAALKECSDGNRPAYHTANHPLPLTSEQTLEAQIVLATLVCIFISIPLSYIPASFVVFLVKERNSKAKHMQLVSNISPYLYWTATYAYDYMLYSILGSLILFCFWFYGDHAAKAFVSDNEGTFALVLLIFLYGLSVLPLVYLYSFLFQNHSSAQIAITTLNFFTGFVFVLAYYTLDAVPETKHMAIRMRYLFRLFPTYNVGDGLLQITKVFYVNLILNSHIGYLSSEGVYWNVVLMAVEAASYFMLVLLAETSFWRSVNRLMDKATAHAAAVMYMKSNPTTSDDDDDDDDDDDLRTEDVLVHTSAPHDFTLCIKDLCKTFPPSLLGGTPKYAVRGVNLACPTGECFGLLGVNGAGKTTLLSILTGELEATSGDAFVTGLSITDSNVRPLIGYCPQVDPLFENLTALETVQFYCRCRDGLLGDDTSVRQRSVELLCSVGLRPFLHTQCDILSGGNKRKLSLAIALIGNPPVLFLDEPSTGMDPESRRQLWDIITKVSANRSVVITTHSMEEGEAICSRVGIMVRGKLTCLGTPQHLKSRFGACYQINLRWCHHHHSTDSEYDTCPPSAVMISDVSDIDSASKGCDDTSRDDVAINKRLEAVYAVLPDVTVVERYGVHCCMRVSSANLDLATAFGVLEDLRRRGEIEEYVLSQATLEQVFLAQAKADDDDNGVLDPSVV